MGISEDLANHALIAPFLQEPAPLLPILHAFHDRDAYLSDDVLRLVAEKTRTPLADLVGTVSFYHHFSTTPGGARQNRVCTGPVCSMNGADLVLGDLEDAVPMPCAGRCEEPVCVLQGREVLVGATASQLQKRPSPLPPKNPGNKNECVFASIRDPSRSTLQGYGSYAALQKARQGTPEQLLEVLDQSRLAGRGGAGFPTGRKWRAVADAAGKNKTVVCNADEGEPGCFKDRALLDHDPHAMIEGMALAAFASGAQTGFIYLRYEYPHTFEVLQQALNDAKDAGFIGDGFEIYLRRGAGAYICGEETSLLNSLEGKHPFPRNRPPYPVTNGFEDGPTVVNNVETLASVPRIVLEGPSWYQSLGCEGHAGTKVISLSGDVQRPGNYEVPMGFSLRELLYDWAGGPRNGRTIQAVTMAGLSGGFLGHSVIDNVTLDEPCLRARGSFLGAGGIMVFDDSRKMMEVARQAMSFFAHESCGKCFPCRIGTQRLTERLATKAGPTSLKAWTDEVVSIGNTMSATSACGLGVAAPGITRSLLQYFPDQVESALSSGVSMPSAVVGGKSVEETSADVTSADEIT